MFCDEYGKLGKENSEGKLICGAIYFSFWSIVKIIFRSFSSDCVNEVRVTMIDRVDDFEDKADSHWLGCAYIRL
jgi:hypothetical protein